MPALYSGGETRRVSISRIAGIPGNIRSNDAAGEFTTVSGKAINGPMRVLNRDVLLCFAFVGLVTVLGSRIPLPGIDPAADQAWLDAAAEAPRWSILFLGLEPFLSVLLVFEALRLLHGLVFRRGLGRRDGLPAPRWLIVVLALLVSLHQAVPFHDALVLTGFSAGDGLSELLVVGTLLAGTALLWLLAERIEVPGLALGGFWLVVSVSWIGSLTAWFTRLIERVGMGAIDPGAAALLCALPCAAIAAIGFSALTLRGDIETSGGDPRRWTALLLWPPMVAESLANALAGWSFQVFPDQPAAILSPSSLAWIVGFCLALPAVLALQVRAVMDISPRGTVWKGRRLRLAILGLVQIAIGCVFHLLPELTAIDPLQGTTLIVIVVVIASAIRTEGSGALLRLRHARHR